MCLPDKSISAGKKTTINIIIESNFNLLLHPQQNSSPFSKTYYAGVVEFAPEPHLANDTSAKRLERTVEAYSSIIASQDAFLADIIVFPEGVLHDHKEAFFLPEPSDLISPCNQPSDFHPALIKLSCSARDAQKYLVINVAEKKMDPTTAILYYNTNIVFDRRGVLISRYRKYNLFDEPGTSVTDEPELSYFTTDFGVTFGHFVCFDILFKTPALDLWANHSIHDFAYPTMWFSELPFMSALQTQNMWATGQHRVNLLAAGANNPSVGSTGSGIYSKNGPISSIFTGVNGTRKILVAQVPKKEFWDDVDVQELFAKVEEDNTDIKDVNLMTDDLSVYATKLLSFPEVGVSSVKETLCHGELCCDFEMTVKREKEVTDETGNFYRHSIMVFDGVRKYGHTSTGGVFTCALVGCMNATLISCGHMYDPMEDLKTEVEFQQLKISGRFRSTKDVEAMPNTMDYGLSPLRGEEYEFQEGKER